jgi:thiosulfate/3-mercaptopyruvate sulfurtransferase
MRFLSRSALLLCLTFCLAAAAASQGSASQPDPLAPGSAKLISPEDLVPMLTSASKPVILNVGPWLLYRQAHIPDAIYIGPGSDKQSLDQLKTQVKPLAKNKAIVLYCGCCPWSHCPNVRPAFKLLTDLGFSNVKVLYIANNLGTDWVYKGYPTIKGQ